MTGNTVTFQAKLGSGHRRQPRPTPPPTATPAPRAPRSDRLARQLALAHHLDRLIDQGVIKDYAEAAKLLGLSRARVTQIMDLLGLRAAEQEQILAGGTAVNEQQLRPGSLPKTTQTGRVSVD